MTNEEMQQTMALILEQHGKASTKIHALIDAQKEAQKHDEARWKASDERWTRTEDGIRALLSIAEIHEREIRTVGQGLDRLTKEILKLGETTQATADRLNVLINIVERHISDGHNGEP